ncbi:MAG: universal stress protein, partial [Nitrospiraceae bacterium]
TMEAITFAEAGEHEYAKKLITGDKPRSKETLLIVGSEEGFSERLVDDSLKMAKRMGYDIRALNVIPVGKRIFSVLQDKVKDELNGNMEKEAEAFSAKASKLRITFTHSVKFGNHDKIIKDVFKECEDILFIVTEPEHVADDSNAAIPIYCIS